MAKAPTLTTITSGYASQTQLNGNFTAIEDAFENTLSLDGSTPNAMNADLDLNGNDLLNGGTIEATSISIDGIDLVDAVASAGASADAAAVSAAAALVSETNAAASEAYVAGVEANLPDWQGEWLTATAYDTGDLVRYDGNAYICLVAHTSGTFSTDLSALKWELFAQKGAAGTGTGDMVAANNLSDVANAATSLANIGGQPLDATLTALAGVTTAANKLIYATGSDTFSTTDLTAFGRTLIDDADASTARTTLGLGTAAVATLIDDDTFATATAANIPSAESVKAYVDANAGNTPDGIDLRNRLFGPVTGNDPVGFTGLDNIGVATLNWHGTIQSGGTMRIRFSNDGGSSWGSYQSIVEGATSTARFGGMTTLDLLTGNFVTSTSEGMSTNGTLTVPSGCNGLQMGNSSLSATDMAITLIVEEGYV